MNSEKIIIVNENDEIIGFKERQALNFKKDFFRISALVVYNSKGEILLAKRRYDKKLDGGKWGPAAAGTNEEMETYEMNIIKETKEEINLNLNNFDFRKSVKIKNDDYALFFVQWFIVKVDEDLSFFKKQDSEVDELRWVKIEAFEKELYEFPEKFTVSMNMHYEKIKEYEKGIFKDIL